MMPNLRQLRGPGRDQTWGPSDISGIASVTVEQMGAG